MTKLRSPEIRHARCQRGAVIGRDAEEARTLGLRVHSGELCGSALRAESRINEISRAGKGGQCGGEIEKSRSERAREKAKWLLMVMRGREDDSNLDSVLDSSAEAGLGLTRY
ncbi:U-box domain-containing protein 38 [Pyrus ussuriensis x Pyrus communis]|uniref:U-box domain-containing protein 38 n=1 Tax=Pyrus ussuriensis x Pyrus communis TaxID=2448454 RepID=A0A5N5GPA4_9ROSA|nr:U-box domain-containing protein 38 [Pyrus ussuriensis x Pyrus communis]